MTATEGDSPAPAPATAWPAAVLWDLDGTLVDTEPLWFAAENDLARRYDRAWTEADALALVGNDLIESGRYIQARMDLPLTPEQIVDELVSVLARAVAGDVEWRPGALALLGSVRNAGVPLGLVTMSYRSIVDPLLDRLGPDTFDVVITGDEVAVGKPEPEPYLAAARALRLDPADCLAIEDSPTGAASADAAGCHVLVVPHHVDVAGGPHRTVLRSLVGLGIEELRRIRESSQASVG